MDYDIPDWSDMEEIGFTFKNYRYFLSEFIRPYYILIDDYSPLKGFDGFYSDSAFSGILIKLSPDNEQVKAFTFYT